MSINNKSFLSIRELAVGLLAIIANKLQLKLYLLMSVEWIG